MKIYDYRSGEAVRPATSTEIDTYLALLNTMLFSEKSIGAVMGAQIAPDLPEIVYMQESSLSGDR